MPIRDDYTASQWMTVQQAPILAGLYVAISGDRPNSVEVYEEAKGILKAMTNDPPQTARNALTTALTEDTKNGAAPPEPALVTDNKTITAEQARAQALQGVLDAVAVVARVSPGEVQGFRYYLYNIAEVTARAGEKGGIFGLGGHAASADEPMLTSLAQSLGVTVAPQSPPQSPPTQSPPPSAPH